MADHLCIILLWVKKLSLSSNDWKCFPPIKSHLCWSAWGVSSVWFKRNCQKHWMILTFENCIISTVYLGMVPSQLTWTGFTWFMTCQLASSCLDWLLAYQYLHSIFLQYRKFHAWLHGLVGLLSTHNALCRPITRDTSNSEASDISFSMSFLPSSSLSCSIPLFIYSQSTCGFSTLKVLRASLPICANRLFQMAHYQSQTMHY